TDGATVAVGFGAARLPIGAIQRDAEDLAEKRYARGEERDVGIEAAAEAMGRFDQERTAGAVTDLRVAGAAVDAESANAGQCGLDDLALGRGIETRRIPLGQGDARRVGVARDDALGDAKDLG